MKRPDEIRECVHHGLTRFKSIRKNTLSDGTVRYGYACVKCRNKYHNDHSIRIKKQCIDYKGGKCEKCGYHKSIAALEFHHLDPSKKDFGISKKRVKWETLKLELDKCILLCANCHREVHSGTQATSKSKS